MVRANRIKPNVYFGRPGSYVTLPYPRGDIDKSYERQTFQFVTGSGQNVVTSYPQGSRPFTLTWNSMHADNFARIEQYWTGMMGTGPWVFVDPSAGNLLLPNQASATSTLRDTSEWSTQGTTAGVLASNSDPAFIHRAGAPRSLRWQFTTGPLVTRPTLVAAAPYRNWPHWPVVQGLPYTYSLWVKTDGVVDVAIGINMRLRWLDSAGAFISDSGNPGFPSYTTVTGSWVRLFVTGTAPVNAYYVQPAPIVDDTTVTLGASLYLDEFLFEQDNVVNDWVPGTGMRPVEIVSLSETAPFDARWRKGMSLTLREVAA